YNDSFNNSDHWAQVMEHNSLTNGNSDSFTCNLAVGISWQFYYAKVGSKEQAEHKIIATAIRKHPLTGLEAKCSKENCSLDLDTELFSSVDFIDVTEPLRPDYAPAPSVKIELPSDFFYPFQTSSGSYTASMINISASIGLLAIALHRLSCLPLTNNRIRMFYLPTVKPPSLSLVALQRIDGNIPSRVAEVQRICNLDILNKR